MLTNEKINDRFGFFCTIVTTPRKQLAAELSGSPFVAALLSREYREVYSVVNREDGKPSQLHKYANGVGCPTGITVEPNLQACPFPENSFDLITGCDVLNTLPNYSRIRNTRNAQLQLLLNMRRYLVKGGKIVMGIENLWDYGRCSSFSTSLRTVKCHVNNRKTFLHTFWGYKKLFEVAKYSRINFHLAVPSHMNPKATCAMSPRSLQEFYKHMFPRPKSPIGRLIFDVMLCCGIIHYFVPAFLVEAER